MFIVQCALLLSVVMLSIWTSCGVVGEKSSKPEASRADSPLLPVYLPEPLRMIAEKAAKGEEIKPDDVPQELRELIANIEVVCEFDRNLHQVNAAAPPTRTGRGLLASLHWLTNSPFAFYTGSGTLSSMQSFTILGKIINSALRLNYGPVRSQVSTTMMPEGRVRS